MKATNKKGSGNILRCFHCLQFCPTNRVKSPVWALFGLFGYDCELFIRTTQGEISLIYFLPLIASIISLTANETPVKRIAFAEVHQLCMIVFDFSSIFIFASTTGCLNIVPHSFSAFSYRFPRELYL